MNSLQKTLKERMNEAGFHHEKVYFSSDSIVLSKNGKDYLHTFNYLNMQFPSDSYLKLNDPSLDFINQFQNENQSIITEKQKKRLSEHWFSEVIDHQFNDEQLDMDFYPSIKGYYIKDKENNHYMLLSIQKYNSEDFTWHKLLKFTNPQFSFPHQDNYIKN